MIEFKERMINREWYFLAPMSLLSGTTITLHLF